MEFQGSKALGWSSGCGRAARPSCSCQGGALDAVRAGGGMGDVKAAVLSWSLWSHYTHLGLPPGKEKWCHLKSLMCVFHV